LAELVNALISEEKPQSKTASKSSSSRNKSTASSVKAQPASINQVQKKKIQETKKTLSSLRFVGDPVLFADDDRNIILVRALPPDYSRIVKIMERLDNLPRQVLIEVIVAQVSLTDELSLGVEWALHNNDLKINNSQYRQEFATELVPDIAGFSYKVLNSVGDPVGLLRTLAKKTDFTLLSSPQVLVLNNEAATVNVGDQVPVVTSETQNTVTTGSVDRTVQYKDTGVILEVTPQINYNGVILLDINQTVSKAIPTTTGVESSATIQTRELKTKLAVKDGQSIMIGGLISKNDDLEESGVPLLKDIPLLGYLFKYEKTTIEKTELLILVTPYVIETDDVLDQYIQEFGKKMDQLRDALHKDNKPVISSIEK
jgi:general secretion pathway protein D